MASSLSDILSAVQNGVIALNNMAVQIKGSFNNILSRFVTDEANIATNTASIAAMQAAWTVWTPTVVPQAGAFTTVSATGGYLVIGKLVHFCLTITITAEGTAAAGVGMSTALPIGTTARAAVAMATETAAVGFSGYGRIPGGGTTISQILKYDNSTFITTGNVVTLTGIYEQT